MKSYGMALVASLVTIGLCACGQSTSSAPPPPWTDQPAISGTPAAFNSDDVAFALDTATSYAQTAALTALVPERSTDPLLLVLAADIDAVQRPTLETLKVFLVQWDSTSDRGSGQAGRGDALPGAVDDATIARLASLRGKDFDAPWLHTMIEHQQGAATLAHAEVAKGANVDAVATAKRLVGTHQAQIARMQGRLVVDS